MNEKQKTKMQNRVKEIEIILEKSSNHDLFMERSELLFKLNKENINFTLKGQNKYYHAKQCKEFENNLKKHGYGHLKKEDILKDGVCFNKYSINNGYNQYCRDIKRFSNKEELLGFVVGYNQSIYNKENY
tara:strand:+ start:83 stop:472 length:390 start_codon:yes stop_codon:yes gene_type:complete